MTTDEKILHLRSLGRPFAEIGPAVGLTKDQAQKRYRKLRPPEPTPAVADALIDGLCPLSLPVPTPRAANSSPSGKIVVASDFHFPLHDERAISVLLGVVSDHAPDAFCVNGDGPDMMAVNRYPKDLIAQTWSLQAERQAWYGFLHELRSALPLNCPLIETNSNHSGGGIEGRWRRYLSERLGELASLSDVADRLSYQKLWQPAWAEMELVDEYEPVPGLVVLHGDIVRAKAGYSAKGMLDKWHGSLIHGHTHRMGVTAYRVPAMGSRPEGVVRAIEGGCMCKLTQHYVKGADWQQGFVVIEYDDTGAWNAVPVYIVDGKAVYGGRVYRA
jgi:hypothetical protein